MTNKTMIIIIVISILIVIGGCTKASKFAPSEEWGTFARFIPNIVFAAPLTNPFGLADVGWHASPAFVDLDNDGDFDIFVGEWNMRTKYFINTGTITSPIFSAGTDSPYIMYTSPTFVDIDNDGDFDIFAGNYDGKTTYFENIGFATAPAFAAPVTNAFGLTDVGYNASPVFVDIDNDGDLDAFIGAQSGNIMYFTNTGSAILPVFSIPVNHPFGLTDVNYCAAPTLVDIDSDGDLDMFVGEFNGNIIYFANIGRADAPIFAAAVANPFGLVKTSVYASPTFIDIDGDADMDIFIGTFEGNTIFQENLQH